jgi:hypothetical protein
MSRISDQCHGIRQESERALDDDENYVERHGNAHASVDAVSRQGMRVAMAVRVTVVVVVGMTVLRMAWVSAPGFVWMFMSICMHRVMSRVPIHRIRVFMLAVVVFLFHQ